MSGAQAAPAQAPAQSASPLPPPAVRPPDPRGATGRLGEALAERYLQKQGLTVVERNYRCRAGEIDLVAAEGETLVFVEVRARRSASFGSPEESITPRKAQRMIACAQTYLAERGTLHHEWRIDLIAVRLQRGRVSRLDHYQDVVEQ